MSPSDTPDHMRLKGQLEQAKHREIARQAARERCSFFVRQLSFPANTLHRLDQMNFPSKQNRKQSTLWQFCSFIDLQVYFSHFFFFFPDGTV